LCTRRRTWLWTWASAAAACTTRISIDDAHRRAVSERKYKLEPLAYILKNSQEYFVCASLVQRQPPPPQHGRHDPVGRRKVHDPRAAAVLARIWGDGAWRPKRAQLELGLLPELVARVALPVFCVSVASIGMSTGITLFAALALDIAQSSSARFRRTRRRVEWAIYMAED
jgi:hypothetical protein